MAALTLRSVKGSPLTNAEVDANFSNLDADVASRLLASSNLSDLTNATTARTNLGLGNVENKSSATIRSEITSGNVTTALGYTPLAPSAIGSTVQAYDADLAAIAAFAPTADNFIVGNGTTWTLETPAQARTSLGLGSLATLSSIDNSNWSGTALTVANGGTGATDAATARTNLGVAIGSNVQAWDADLDSISGLAGNVGLLRKTAANTWSLDTNTYLTGNQSITISGDASGSGATAISLTLANSGVTAGTYRSVTVDAKGRVTAGTNPTTLSGYGITDALSSSTTSTQNGYFGDIFLYDDSTPSHYLQITNSANLTAARSLSLNVNDANRTISLSGNLTVSSAATISGTNTGDQTITLTGDVSGTGTGSFATTLANSGVVAGSYGGNNSIPSLTVDAKGRVTSASTVTPSGTWGISISGDAASVDGKSFGTFTAAGGIVYATSTTAASATGAGTSGQALLSGGAGAPTWGTLSAGAGGTGQTTYATGDLLYASSTSALSRLAAGTSGQFLKSAGASAPAWATLQMNDIPDAAFKKSVRAATTADLGASTWSTTGSGTLTGYASSASLAVTTTVSSTTATTTSTAGIKVGATISGNANIPAGATVASITNATTFVMSAAATAAGTSVTTTFTNSIAALSIDGVAVAAGDRVLVKNQSTLGGITDASGAAKNGIYTVSNAGSASVAWVLVRATDADTNSKIGCAIVAVDAGTANGSDTWTNTFKATDTLNTTAMNWYEMLYNTGTWGISVTGSAGSTTVLNQIATFPTGNSQNFNSLTTGGYYNIVWGNFSGTLNTPTNAANSYGTLLVESGSNFITQTYTPHGANASKVVRTYYDGVWQPWVMTLTSANYTSYSPSLTGSGASGTWGINVTGSSGSTPLLSALSNYVWSQSTLPNSYNLGIQASFVGPGAGEGSWQNYGSVMTMRTYSGGGGSLQLYVPYGPGNGGTGLQVRFGNYDVSSGNAWTSWKTLLASDNFSSYAFPLSGGTITGNLTIRNTSPTIYMRDTDNNVAMLHCNSNLIYILRGATDSDSWSQVGGYWPAYWDLTNNNATFGGSLWCAGNVTAYSDEKVKANWSSLPGDFVELLASVKSGTFDRTDIEARQVGVSAQSLQRILPEAVGYHEKEDLLSVAYGNAALASAVELAKRVVDQEARIKRLEAMIQKLIGE